MVRTFREDRKFKPTFFFQWPPSMLLNTHWCGPWVRQPPIEDAAKPRL